MKHLVFAGIQLRGSLRLVIRGLASSRLFILLLEDGQIQTVLCLWALGIVRYNLGLLEQNG